MASAVFCRIARISRLRPSIYSSARQQRQLLQPDEALDLLKAVIGSAVDVDHFWPFARPRPLSECSRLATEKDRRILATDQATRRHSDLLPLDRPFFSEAMLEAPLAALLVRRPISLALTRYGLVRALVSHGRLWRHCPISHCMRCHTILKNILFSRVKRRMTA